MLTFQHFSEETESLTAQGTTLCESVIVCVCMCDCMVCCVHYTSSSSGLVGSVVRWVRQANVRVFSCCVEPSLARVGRWRRRVRRCIAIARVWRPLQCVRTCVCVYLRISNSINAIAWTPTHSRNTVQSLRTTAETLSYRSRIVHVRSHIHEDSVCASVCDSQFVGPCVCVCTV